MAGVAGAGGGAGRVAAVSDWVIEGELAGRKQGLEPFVMTWPEKGPVAGQVCSLCGGVSLWVSTECLGALDFLLIKLLLGHYCPIPYKQRILAVLVCAGCCNEKTTYFVA